MKFVVYETLLETINKDCAYCGIHSIDLEEDFINFPLALGHEKRLIADEDSDKVHHMNEQGTDYKYKPKELKEKHLKDK